MRSTEYLCSYQENPIVFRYLFLVQYTMTCQAIDLPASREDIIRRLEELAPPELAESFDTGRIGLIIEGRDKISVIHTCLDVTPVIVSRAIKEGCDLLIAHHTPIWNPVTSITGNDASLLRSILSSGLNIYVMHTNWDHAPSGVNDTLATLLSMTDTVPLSLGLVGDCSLSPEEIAKRLHAPLRVWGRVEKLSRLAIVGGSGFDMDLIDEAVELGADAFLSAELRHSVYRSSPVTLLESTHYALESPAMRALAVLYGWTYLDDPPLIHSFS